jgi:DNA-directed RNA polymerase subunit alpha
MEKIVLPNKFDTITQNQFYGKFAIYPFEKGFGHTVGNSLRRILLSSLEGAAITSCRIRGVSHEFSTIRGVKEDVIYILMNLKKIRFKLYSEGSEKISLSIKGPKEVVAGDFETSHNVEIVNKDQLVATVDSNGTLEIEAEVNKGRGYAFADDNKKPGYPVDTLFIDSIFSPIIKVNYEVETTRVGQKTDYDKLILEVWTDGTILPEDSIIYSANILKDMLKIFFTKSILETKQSEPEELSQEEIAEKEHLKQLLSQPIEILELSTRSYNCLKDAKIDKISDLVTKTEEELKTIRNLGEKSLEEIKDKLKSQNLSLGMNI